MGFGFHRRSRSTSPASAETGASGRSPGGYQILERLAVGGMGEIFLAREVGLAGFERLVVLKRLLPSARGERERVELFIDEARVAAHLTHPNIVAIHDFGCDEHGFFIAMEYVAGQNLAVVCARAAALDEAIPRELAVHIVRELARGLAYAHEAVDSHGRPLHVVHRDVSPQNTLISYDGDVKLLDFGIAKAANALHRTDDGVLRGKYGYMAPEQLDGVPLTVRADVFAAGVMLWELTLGRRLYDGADPIEARERLRRLEVPEPGTIDPDYPPDLEDAVMAALARDPARRTATASALVEKLSAYLERCGGQDARARLARRMSALFADRDPVGSAVRPAPTGASAAPRLGDSAATVALGPPIVEPSAGRARARRSPRRRTSAAVAAVALAAAVIGVVSWRALQHEAPPPRASAAAAADVRTLAIHQRYARARAVAEELFEAFPDDAAVLSTKVLVSWWSGSPSFYPLADRARKASLPESERALVEGLFLLDTGRVEEAIAFLREQAARRPGDPAVAYALGEALWHGQRLADGAAELERALHLDPSWAVGLEHVVDHHLSVGAPAALQAVSARLAAHDPVAAAAVDAARAASEGLYQDGLAIIDAARATSGDSPLLWRRRAEILAVLGDYEAGREAARRAFEIDPIDDRDDGAFALWTEFYLYEGDLDGYFAAMAGRGSRASMLVRAFWLDEQDIGAPPPVRTDRATAATWQSRMPAPPLWAAVSLLGAHRAGDDAAHYYRDHPMREIRAYGAALAAEARGDWASSADALRRALDTPAVGDLRLLLSYQLARARVSQGDLVGAAEACGEVIRPRVYAPYRGVLLPDCLRWSAATDE